MIDLNNEALTQSTNNHESLSSIEVHENELRPAA